ncbi:MAG: hypothetical protein AB7V46_11885, partial [Thermomicrobiales bacterium]
MNSSVTEVEEVGVALSAASARPMIAVVVVIGVRRRVVPVAAPITLAAAAIGARGGWLRALTIVAIEKGK